MGVKKHRSRFDNTKILRFSERAAQELTELRDFTESVGTGKLSNLSKVEPDQIFTTKQDGVEFGYQIQDFTAGGLALEPYYQRRIFVKFPGYKIEEIPDKDLQSYMVAVLEVCVDKGNDIPEISKCAPDCIQITQKFMPSLLTNTQPGLVSIAGGLDA